MTPPDPTDSIDSVDPGPIVTYVPMWLRRSERFIWQQVRDLGRVHVLTRELTGAAAEFPVDRLTVLKPEARSLRSVDFRSAKMLQRVRAHNPPLPPIEYARAASALHRARLAYVMFLWNALEVAGPARLARTPLVVHAAGSDVTAACARGRDYVAGIGEVFAQADRILCGSSFLRDRAVDLGAPADRCIVHHLGIDVPEPVERAGPSDCIRVLAVSRLHAVKGVDRSIRAFAAALADRPAELTVVGAGPEQDALEALVAELEIGDRVRFAGELPHDEVYGLMATADVFVQHNVTTSEGAAEGLGGTLVEASAHGLPVVATRSGGVPEAVIDGETGYLVEEDDLDAMADRIRSLADSPEHRMELGHAGRAFVEREHDARVQNRRLAELLSDVSD